MIRYLHLVQVVYNRKTLKLKVQLFKATLIGKARVTDHLFYISDMTITVHYDY